MRLASVSRPVSAEHVAFQLGPRINAAGRMEDALLALDLLLASDDETAAPLAQRLQDQNLDRQRATSRIVREARALVVGLDDGAPVIVLGSDEWPVGLIGLAASRLVEEFYRPAFIFNLEGQEFRGSARSIEGFPLHECLARCAPLLLRYGGHAMAAGLTVARDRFQELRHCLEVDAASRLGGQAFSRPIPIEAVSSLADLKPSLCQELQLLAPFGIANREPLLLSREVEVVRAETFGSEDRHLRVTLRDRTASAEAIAFDRGFTAAHLPPGRRLDVVYRLDCERWEGFDRVRLHLRDLRGAGLPARAPAEAGSAALR
jgi:single-stranded-DNA-specific exonuclease